ncbi:hypothetical protein IWQ56_003726, partial [Coemansia nantahalensis]
DAVSSIANEDLEFDESLAAELEQGLEELGDDDEDDEDDDDDESDDEDNDDDDDEQPSNERAMQMKLLGEEVAELEHTIKKKRADLDSAPNPIIRKRFEDIIQKLQNELDAKKLQLGRYAQEVADEHAGAGASAEGAGDGHHESIGESAGDLADGSADGFTDAQADAGGSAKE